MYATTDGMFKAQVVPLADYKQHDSPMKELIKIRNSLRMAGFTDIQFYVDDTERSFLTI